MPRWRPVLYLDHFFLSVTKRGANSTFKCEIKIIKFRLMKEHISKWVSESWFHFHSWTVKLDIKHRNTIVHKMHLLHGEMSAVLQVQDEYFRWLKSPRRRVTPVSDTCSWCLRSLEGSERRESMPIKSSHHRRPWTKIVLNFVIEYDIISKVLLWHPWAWHLLLCVICCIIYWPHVWTIWLDYLQDKAFNPKSSSPFFLHQSSVRSGMWRPLSPLWSWMDWRSTPTTASRCWPSPEPATAFAASRSTPAPRKTVGR